MTRHYQLSACALALLGLSFTACGGDDIFIGATSSSGADDDVGESGTATNSGESGGMDQGTDTAGTDTAGTGDTSSADNSADNSADTGSTDVDTTDVDTTDVDTTDVDTTDTGSSDTGSTDTGSTDTGSTDTGSTDTGGNDVCDPQLLDFPCLECIKESCCTQIEACLGDAACDCAYDCVTMNGDPQQCQIDCNAFNGVTNALLLCGQLNCANDCIP